ncbi:UDP-N-acetylglucosamine 2-epimerase [Maribacter hydrothermalis]|uniref:UDP-N-acetyl-D-glucosamine 2-epimerase, UDP-hydrolysing n=1 Tax=Maribacter hydrothermalis TaxID=1836467 RepID=A0A1B7ZEH2_9FLAO|nr:UDP-N-acetylglucosamine 2-epimerase [Maribacter hydrothermalis]APQ17354.1 UDP-N-acetyl-D-glucosamine 2-epimerase, UDP-hydrolysing [Maribacter hydrothermalis]OBR41832.1 UDP-N-acetyl-D-glucosamine 2-epimerase, UDP-hydrolysing [Maribacter hydrothermalis]
MRKIAVITGTRAEYGLLKPLIKAIDGAKNLQLQLLVTGMHLMPEFGNTYLQIVKDGFTIDAKIEDGLNGDSALDISKAVGKATIGFAQAFSELNPEMIVVLGDRSEILAAVTAAVINNIPVAHIHGGETTEGAYDEFIRHAITKMSHLHFASCEVYRKRIIQLGEQPHTVFNVGAIGIDSIKNLQLLDKKSFEESISKTLDEKSVLITFHPVTMENSTAEVQFNELLSALDDLKNTTLIFTKPNSDKGGKTIIEMIDSYVENNTEKAISFTSLGQLRYLSALKHVDFVIGNSSSGILEVPYFHIPTINIGDRQKGRVAPISVIHCKPTAPEISSAILKTTSKKFLDDIKNQELLFGDGDATHKIMNQLIKFDNQSLKKSFYDLKPTCFEKL